MSTSKTTMGVALSSVAVASFAFCAMIVSLAWPVTALAGELSVGAGMRSSFNIIENPAPGADDSTDFDMNSVRLYTGGDIQENIGFTFNTGYEAATNSVEVLDVIGRFEFSDAFNIWAGRHLPPSDRSNLSGPYFLGHWNFPAAQRYPAVFAGRAEGISVWGQQGGGQFKYQAGLYEGPDALAAGDDDETLFAGRLTLNFLDPEPGYYNSSTYFGDKEIFAVGLVAQSFDSGTGTSVDVLFEKPTGAGTLTLEGAVYSYDEFAGSDGDGMFALVSYLLPGGGWQPTARIQTTDIDAFDAATGTVTETGEVDTTELGVNYIIDGHNARLSMVLGNREFEGGGDQDFFNLGLQLQI